MICFFSNLLVSYLCTVALWPYGHINENADCLAKGRLWFLSPPQNKQQKPVLDQLFRVSSPHSNSPYGQDIKLRNSNIYLIGWWYHHVNLRLFFKTLYFKRNFFGKKRFTPKNTKIDVPIFTPGGRRILGGMLSPPPKSPWMFHPSNWHSIQGVGFIESSFLSIRKKYCFLHTKNGWRNLIT